MQRFIVSACVAAATQDCVERCGRPERLSKGVSFVNGLGSVGAVLQVASSTLQKFPARTMHGYTSKTHSDICLKFTLCEYIWRDAWTGIVTCVLLLFAGGVRHDRARAQRVANGKPPHSFPFIYRHTGLTFTAMKDFCF